MLDKYCQVLYEEACQLQALQTAQDKQARGTIAVPAKPILVSARSSSKETTLSLPNRLRDFCPKSKYDL